MIKDERYAKIYEYVRMRGSVTVQYLTKHVFASEATIRRDLEEMEKRGMLKRVWGGAILPTLDKDIPSFVRIKSNPEKKEKIAEIASLLLKSSTSIFFDSSTTCLALVPYMKQHKNIFLRAASVTGYILTGQILTDPVRFALNRCFLLNAIGLWHVLLRTQSGSNTKRNVPICLSGLNVISGTGNAVCQRHQAQISHPQAPVTFGTVFKFFLHAVGKRTEADGMNTVKEFIPATQRFYNRPVSRGFRPAFCMPDNELILR